MGKLRLSVCGVVALVCLPLTAANAAPVTESFAFNLTGFTAGSPVSSWTGSFTIMFDPTATSSAGLTAFSSNLTGYGTFSYANSAAMPPSLGFLDIYNDAVCTGTTCSLTSGHNNALMEFDVTASGGLTFVEASITSATTTGFFGTETGTVTQTPLPAALPLFATGLGGLGLLGWRRKRGLSPPPSLSSPPALGGLGLLGLCRKRKEQAIA